MRDVTMIPVAGVRSAVFDSQPGGSEEAVVCVHGNPGPMEDYDWLVPETSSFARTVALDLPGFGRADHPRQFDFTVNGYARHLGGVLDALGVQRAHLVLHDFGGPFGLAWAAAAPERCASLTLINTGVLTNYRWHSLARIWQTPIVGELFQLVTTPGRMKRLLDQQNPRPIPRAYIERVLQYADWAHKRTVLKLYRATRDPERHFAALAPALARLDVPVCVAWGSGDPYLPVVHAEQQRSVFPRAEVHRLEGLGHWPFIDDPAAVRAVVMPFLHRQLGSAYAGRLALGA
jgi:pimeloyl-ACP methyl ester carboxylesterase